MRCHQAPGEVGEKGKTRSSDLFQSLEASDVGKKE